MEPDVDFWSRDLKVLREERGLSQRQLAKLANVHRTTLRNIELGKGKINPIIYDRLLNALGYALEPVPQESSLDRLRRQAAKETDPRRRSELAARILLNWTTLD